ncbi:MAG: 3-oxoacyl-[acyl-carrier-protein] synthase II [Verrucomicrobiales bacterium]|jgi:3-oxoacyl-[acyl-carrier-protein] synthase II
MNRRVVITGLGVVTSLGCELEKFWNNLAEGSSGVRRVQGFDPSDSKCQIGAEVRDFDTTQHFANKRDAKRADRYIQFSISASKLAVAQAGLDFDREDPDRAGAFLGTGVGGLQTTEDNVRRLIDKGPNKVSVFAIPMMIGNAAGGILAADLGITGPNFCHTSACATGGHAIGEAWKAIKFDEAEVMIAGGSESAVTRLAYAGFGNMKALSKRNDDPQRASRPFDADRDGFVMGEGAGVVVLEELEHARQRGAEIYCELVGYGTSADAFHPTMPHPDGRGASQCMERAIKRAGLNLSQIDYLNAHGTATQHGDLIETKAIKNTFGDHAKNGLLVSSTKSMTGHLLGASGGVELAACVLAIRNGVAPPTINLETPDPACDLDYVPNEARETKITTALSNSFGFGGTNASLIVSKFEK